MTELDWGRAARRAAQLAPAGRTTSPARMRGLVHSLHGAAVEALPLVGDITGLHEAVHRAESNPVYVVDRARWAESNARTFGILAGSGLSEESVLGSRSSAEEIGIILAFLSPRVLGQFDPFAHSRLLLVAPNILAAERALALDAMDFRLWVCLHEQTHAVQFAAAPWLAEHMETRIGALTIEVAERDGGSLIADAVSVLKSAVSGGSADDAITGALTPAEREQFDALIALMSLLEGHADVVMDEVGPERIPGIRRIRARFNQRREGSGGLNAMVRKMLGLDLKLAQYRDGAAFVRAVIAESGHEGLNAVWREAANLPTPAEIANPTLWLARVPR